MLLWSKLVFLKKTYRANPSSARRSAQAVRRIPGGVPGGDQPGHPDHHQELRQADQPLRAAPSRNFQGLRFTGTYSDL